MATDMLVDVIEGWIIGNPEDDDRMTEGDFVTEKAETFPSTNSER